MSLDAVLSMLRADLHGKFARRALLLSLLVLVAPSPLAVPVGGVPSDGVLTLVVDTNLGIYWVEPREPADFAAPPEPSDTDQIENGVPHDALGEVRHYCADEPRECYSFAIFEPALMGTDLYPIPTRVPLERLYVAAKAAYEQAGGQAIVPLPIRGGTVFYVWGTYQFGGHTTPSAAQQPFGGGVGIENGALGEGEFHADRSMIGVGVGRFEYFAIGWSPGVVYSEGRINAHGTWRFCETEYAKDCQPPHGLIPGHSIPPI